MVFFHEYKMNSVGNDQHVWRDLISQDGKPPKKDLNASTKQQMLAEYEEKTGKNGGKRKLSRIPLWYFLHEILAVDQCNELVSWEDQSNLVFTINKPNELAVLWGLVKNKETMTYPKLARGIRYYYGKGVIEKHRGKRFCYKFILSNKTTKVLLNQKTISEETLTSVPKSSLKRKSTENCDSEVTKRRRNSSASTDSNEIMSDCCSSEEEEESLTESEWNSLDACLAEIFSDASCMEEIFNKDKLFPNTATIGNDTIKEEELHNSFNLDSNFFCKQELDESLSYSVSQVPKSLKSAEYNPFDARKKTMSESDTFLPNMFSCFSQNQLYTSNKNNNKNNNNVNNNNIKNNNIPSIPVCRSLPDFSILQSMYNIDHEQQRIHNNNYISTDTYLQDLDPLIFETSFMENVM